MSSEKVVRSTSAEPVLSSYLNRKGCALGLPISGNFELTARCNFNCKMCYVHQLDKQGELRQRELTADQWLSLASDARDMGLIFLLLTGGEPFIRHDFAKIYTELIKMGLMVSINTNASLYNEELRTLFKHYPPTRINVTLYGGSEETYESLCGNASYEKVVANLRSMKADELPLRLNVSLTPYNVGDMRKIDKVSREIGLQAKAASYMYPPVRLDGQVGNNCGRFTADEAGCAIAEWNRLRDTDEMFRIRTERIRTAQAAEMTDSCIDVEQEGVMCRAGRSSFWMTWEGHMIPCGTMNVPPAKPLEIGFAKAWEEVRALTAAIRLPKECSACPLKANCGVCAAICKGETGHFDKKPEYLCALTKKMCSHTIELANNLK